MPSTDDLRLLSVGELRSRADRDSDADRQSQLRVQGRALAVAALDRMGYRFSGTGGWWVTAYATPDRCLGFVNIAHGVAVSTCVLLADEVIEACTLPGQDEGPVASGAAVWAAPDPGEAFRAKAPAGWRQLLVDVRSSNSVPEVELSDRFRADIIRWGLPTCYDRPGFPGYVRLEGSPLSWREPHTEPGGALPALEPHSWPRTPATGAMRAVATAGLADVTAHLAQHLPSVAAVLPDVHAARETVLRTLDWSDRHAAGRGTYTAGGAAESASRAAGPALADAGLIWLSQLASVPDGDGGGGRGEAAVCRYILEAVLVRRLDPVADLLATHLGPLTTDDGRSTPAYRALESQLQALAPALAHELLREAEVLICQATMDAVAAYVAGGPIEVLIPDHGPQR